MRLPVALASLAFLVFGAGCSQVPAADDLAPPSTAGTAPLESIAWGLDGCRFLIGFVQVADAALAAQLPEGFSPAPGMLPAGGPVLGIEAFECDGGIGLDGQWVKPIAYGSVFASASPPDDLAIEGTSTYWVKWDTLVPDAPRREALVAAGLPAHDGRTEVSDGPGPRTATLELDGDGAFTVTAAPAPFAQQAPGPGRFAEFTPTADGLARWNASAIDMSTSLGAGVVTVPAGSMAASLIGAQTAPATIMAGSWSFTEGATVFRVR